MTEKELKKLKRSDLLELLLLQSRESGSELDIQALEAEIKRVHYHKKYLQVLRSTIGTLLVVAAIAVLISTLALPVLRIRGTSMQPTLIDGDIVMAARSSDFKTGDLIAFYYNNKILIKRVIATSGNWVDIDEDGNVYVNDEQIEEPYLQTKAYGDCNIELPYQVPESRIFVMGDNRSISVDSRNTTIGCISNEQIVGKLLFRIWPFPAIGRLNRQES
jgi:signal peptidase I